MTRRIPHAPALLGAALLSATACMEAGVAPTPQRRRRR